MKRGFSLIELLVVIAIIAMLVGIAAPYYSDYVKESKFAKAKADLDVLKQSIILYNSREDLPYQGPLATTSPFLPLLGESDFQGLQGQYLTVVPLDPWSKNYKLDPYGGFVFSDGPDSRTEKDDIREYYIKELALRKIEWEDTNNNRTMDDQDIIYMHFNKSLWVTSLLATDFDVYENNQVISTMSFDITFNGIDNPGYTANTATQSTLICRVNGNAISQPRLGIHAIALKDTLSVLQKYQEVLVNRSLSTPNNLITKIDTNPVGNTPLRFAIRTAPIKIIPKS